MACGFSILAMTRARPLDDFLDFGDFLGALHEGQGDPVHSGLHRRFEIDAILGGHGGEGNFGVRQADALAVGNAAGKFDHSHRPVRRGLEDMQAQTSVVDQHHMTRPQGDKNFRMGKANPGGVAGRRIGVEDEFLSGDEIGAAASKNADAQFRSLQIDQHADRPPNALLDGANHRDALAHGVGIGVAHVDAEQVGARPPQIFDGRLVIGGGTKRGDDLAATKPNHARFLPLGERPCSATVF